MVLLTVIRLELTMPMFAMIQYISTHTIDCGNVTGEVFAIDLQPDTSCAALFSVKLLE